MSSTGCAPSTPPGARSPDPLVYLDEVGPALAQVRLLASGPVRSAALAVHLQLEKLHTGGSQSTVPGVEPQKHFRELPPRCR